MHRCPFLLYPSLPQQASAIFISPFVYAWRRSALAAQHRTAVLRQQRRCGRWRGIWLCSFGGLGGFCSGLCLFGGSLFCRGGLCGATGSVGAAGSAGCTGSVGPSGSLGGWGSVGPSGSVGGSGSPVPGTVRVTVCRLWLSPKGRDQRENRLLPAGRRCKGLDRQGDGGVCLGGRHGSRWWGRSPPGGHWSSR